MFSADEHVFKNSNIKKQVEHLKGLKSGQLIDHNQYNQLPYNQSDDSFDEDQNRNQMAAI